MINETARRLTPAGETGGERPAGGIKGPAAPLRGGGVTVILPSYPLGPSPPSHFPPLFLFPSVLAARDVKGGQFVPLIGVIAATVIDDVKRNERVKKKKTTVHYTPAAAEKKGNSSPSLWGG